MLGPLRHAALKDLDDTKTERDIKMSDTDSKRVSVVAKRGFSTDAIIRALSTSFPDADIQVIYERRVPRTRLLRRRAARLGWAAAAGQLAFMVLVYPLLARFGATRQKEIEDEVSTSYTEPPRAKVVEVPSVNSAEAKKALADHDPDVVVVSGTRIISRDTLAAVQAPFINMHAGITPAYRGVHGAYWALQEGYPDRVGTTVHLVDEGIDTGRIIEQVCFAPSQRDTFATYPALHVKAGLPALMRAVDAALRGELETKPPPDHPSTLRYHPTIWTYLRGWLGRGVR